MNVSSTNISWFEVANFGDLFIYINSYKIYLNGKIEQWKLSVNAMQSISFAITLSNSKYTVTTSVETNGSNATYNISDKQTNGFYIYSNQGSGIKGDLYIIGY